VLLIAIVLLVVLPTVVPRIRRLVTARLAALGRRRAAERVGDTSAGSR